MMNGLRVGDLVEKATLGTVVAVAAAMAWIYFIAPAIYRPMASGAATAVPTAPLDIHGAVLGNVQAPVVIIEYADFQCPFCAQFFRNTFKEVRKYVESGRVRFVFNNLPLESIHPAAFKAAVAAECAREQGQFWPVHDALFIGQGELAGLLPSLPGQLGLQAPAFSTCSTGESAATAAVQSDIQLARRLGLTATPTFLIGTALSSESVKIEKVLTGAIGIDALRTAIDGISGRK